jgi:hypothetical protein
MILKSARLLRLSASENSKSGERALTGLALWGELNNAGASQ